MSSQGIPCSPSEGEYDFDSDSSMHSIEDEVEVYDFDMDSDTDLDDDNECIPYNDTDYSVDNCQEGSGRPVPSMYWRRLQTNAEEGPDKMFTTLRSAKYVVDHEMRDITELKEFQDEIEEGFYFAVKDLIEGVNKEFSISVSIVNPSLQTPVYVPPQKIKDFRKSSFLETLYRLVQSNTEFILKGTIDVRVRIYNMIDGGGKSKKVPKAYDDDMKRSKNSIIRVQSNGNSCGYSALAIGLKYHQWSIKGNCRHPQWVSLIRYVSKQKDVGEELCRKLKIEFETKMDFKTLEKIQKSNEFLGYQIIVIEFKSQRQLFKGPEAEKEIYLLWDENHFDLIKEMNAYVGRTYYCKHCNRGFQSVNLHKCDNTCQSCRSTTKCTPGNVKIPCNSCGNFFESDQCFDNHIRNRLCQNEKCCPKCEIKYRVDKNHKHICDEYQCHLCNEYYMVQPHLCFLKTKNMEKLQEEDKVTKIIVSFDIESMLIQNKENVFDHKAILVCAKVLCTNCYDTNQSNCITCGSQNYTFYGQNCINDFNNLVIKDLAMRANKAGGYVLVIAHNLSGYDGHFILTDLMNRNMQHIKPIMNGTKLMKIDMDNVNYIDSLLFFQRPLADLNKMFDIPEAEKGFFPHYFNIPENQNKVIPFSQLTKEHYGYEQMSTKRAKEFDNWFQTKQNSMFDFQKELRKYCVNDVEILIQAIIRFRKLFIEKTSLDPLTRNFTLASIGLEYFRAQVLEEGRVGITPINGYNYNKNDSMAGRAWIDFKQKQYNKKIIREYRIGRYTADGAIVEGSKVIAFEYNGCFFHGHRECGKYNKEKDDHWNNKVAYYQKRGIQLVFIYECQWKNIVDKKRHPNYNQRVSTYFTQRYNYYKKIEAENLECNPRKALHGGRTNNLKFYCVPQNNEKLFYYDVVSLYPYVLSKREFPMGHPIKITEEFGDINNYFGFISCKVLPPTDLKIPVLPFSMNGKLLFPLCAKCATEQNQNNCECEEDQRCLKGTFTTIELQKALELGYEIKEIYEVLHYTDKSDSMFSEYINRWYKIKAEASGWPNWAVSNEDKQRYLSDFKRKENIELDPTKIDSNPGLRSIAKLMLNSLWGKLAQRPNQPETKIVRDYQELHNLLNDESITILGDDMIENMILMNYKLSDDSKANPRNTSVAIAAFVTSWARLKLYEIMEQLDNVLYYDTDSVIFCCPEGGNKPQSGPFLGEMTNEVEEEFGMGAEMTEFYSIGPKVYSYRVVKANGAVVDKFKAKGITQTVESVKDVNFDVIKTKASNKANNQIIEKTLVNQMQFRANRLHEVVTKHLKKDFRVTSDKRRIIGNDTVPYGFIDQSEEDFANLMISN